MTAVVPVPVNPAQLARIVQDIAAAPGRWLPLVRYDPGRRWYRRLAQDGEHEVWLLSWLPGQQTGFHDHGPSAGAFTVARGQLHERTAPSGRPETPGRTLPPGTVRSFGPRYIHDVMNASMQPAVSIHAYSPPLTMMRRFDAALGRRLKLAGVERSW